VSRIVHQRRPRRSVRVVSHAAGTPISTDAPTVAATSNTLRPMIRSVPERAK